LGKPLPGIDIGPVKRNGPGESALGGAGLKEQLRVLDIAWLQLWQFKLAGILALAVGDALGAGAGVFGLLAVIGLAFFAWDGLQPAVMPEPQRQAAKDSPA